MFLLGYSLSYRFYLLLSLRGKARLSQLFFHIYLLVRRFLYYSFSVSELFTPYLGLLREKNRSIKEKLALFEGYELTWLAHTAAPLEIAGLHPRFLAFFSRFLPFRLRGPLLPSLAFLGLGFLVSLSLEVVVLLLGFPLLLFLAALENLYLIWPQAHLRRF